MVAKIVPMTVPGADEFPLRTVISEPFGEAGARPGPKPKSWLNVRARSWDAHEAQQTENFTVSSHRAGGEIRAKGR